MISGALVDFISIAEGMSYLCYANHQQRLKMELYNVI